MSDEKDSIKSKSDSMGVNAATGSGARASAEPVVIALTREQTRAILLTTAQRQDFTIRQALSGMLSGNQVSVDSVAGPPPSAALVSHTLFRGLLVLAYFVAIEGSASLERVSQQVGLAKSTTHRYVRAFMAHGLLSQDPRTREYRLMR